MLHISAITLKYLSYKSMLHVQQGNLIGYWPIFEHTSEALFLACFAFILSAIKLAMPYESPPPPRSERIDMPLSLLSKYRTLNHRGAKDFKKLKTSISWLINYSTAEFQQHGSTLIKLNYWAHEYYRYPFIQELFSTLYANVLTVESTNRNIVLKYGSY